MNRAARGVILALWVASATAGDEQARVHWMLNCQGCHQADASGSAGGAPSMAGTVSRFLAVEGGREYLAMVPGVAFAPLSDADLAALLTWSLRTFDPAHLPSDFTPYTAAEVKRFRNTPLVTEAAERRTQLLSELETTMSR